MKAVKDKIRFALWLKPETMEKIRTASAQDDCGSLSEFIEKAVLAYLGYDQKESGIRFYQDEMPERVPLTDNPEFRTIKNMILQEAETLALADLPDRVVQEKHGGEEAKQAKTGDYNQGKNVAKHNTNHSHSQVATTVAHLFASLAQLLYEDPNRHLITRIDRKQRRQIDEKKLAQGMKLE